MDELLLGHRYRTTEKVGTGGMADVYKAVDATLGRTVAVKVMHARFAADASFAARFRQEARAVANLASPNIVNIYDWGADGDTCYIVMEYVRGDDLKSIIRHQHAMPSRQVAEIGAQVCSALTAAHGYGIIHRDIKPHNIMVQPDGSVKVMDFGIARAGDTAMTAAGSVLGTAQYMSPEQAQGKEPRPAGDLYSLGIVLYEAATGVLPFDSDTPVVVALKQVNECAVAPHVVNPDIDPALDAVIVKAMQKDPADRYVSADDLRRDLLAIANGSPAAAVTTAGALAGDASAGTTALMRDVAGLPLVDATAVMPRVSGTKRGGDSRSTAASSRRRQRGAWIAAALLLAGLGAAWGAGHLGRQSALARPSAPVSQIAAVPDVRSKGPEMIPVPNVVGMVEADAFSTIEKAGFSPQALPSQFNNDVPANAVYTQAPAGDRRAIRGSIVTYVLSRGAVQVEVVVPDRNAGQDGNSGNSKHDRGRWWQAPGD